MKFGVNLINFGPGVTPESLARTVALVEALGYHFVMTSDHVAVTSDVSGRCPAPLYEPFTLLGWLAAAPRSGARSATATRGIPSWSRSAGCATPACPDCARSPRRKAAPCLRCARASASS